MCVGDYGSTKSSIVVNLMLDSIPLLPGAADCVGMGILSSLQPQNIRCARAVGNIHLGEGKLLNIVLSHLQ